MTARRPQKKIDTIEKLAELVVESMEDLRSDMSGHFDVVGDQLSALQERVTAVESKIADCIGASIRNSTFANSITCVSRASSGTFSFPRPHNNSPSRRIARWSLRRTRGAIEADGILY
jgi:hypothetical protein